MGLEHGNWYKVIMTLGTRAVSGLPREGTPDEPVDCKDGLVQFCAFAADNLQDEKPATWPL